jgi:hypothetical protein
MKKPYQSNKNNCKFFINGDCFKGKSCQFKHTTSINTLEQKKYEKLQEFEVNYYT